MTARVVASGLVSTPTKNARASTVILARDPTQVITGMVPLVSRA